MIKFRNKIFPDYFIDPVTAIITNSKGEVQKTKIRRGRPYFKCHKVHEWQVHTHIGYQKGLVIHHLDHDKMNNALSNLGYLTRSEHAKIHMKGENNPMFGKTGGMYGKHHSLETKRKMSEAKNNMSEETKRKISESLKGKNTWTSNLKWFNNGIENRYIPFDEEIPEGFIKGRLKK